MAEHTSWIVWSNEHRAFWRPKRCGYTTNIELAGRYTKTEADTICNGANYRSSSDLAKYIPPEICMPAPEAIIVNDDLVKALEVTVAELKVFAAMLHDDFTRGQINANIAKAEAALARAKGGEG